MRLLTICEDAIPSAYFQSNQSTDFTYLEVFQFPADVKDHIARFVWVRVHGSVDGLISGWDVVVVLDTFVGFPKPSFVANQFLNAHKYRSNLQAGVRFAARNAETPSLVIHREVKDLFLTGIANGRDHKVVCAEKLETQTILPRTETQDVSPHVLVPQQLPCFIRAHVLPEPAE